MSAPARPHEVVAVLEKRGRFWTAEPLFTPARDRAPRGPSGGPIALGARLAGSAAAGARAGDIVLVRSGPDRAARARLAGVIGRPDVARDVIEALMRERGLARAFDAEVEREAERAREQSHNANAHGPRRDLRELPTFTVDPRSARDFDDALSAAPVDGGVRVWVHIADVSAHVAQGSLLDLEARRRATSVYVPGAVEPMLPHALSSDACSLVAGRDRPAVTVELDLHGSEVRRSSFYRSLIRSDARLDYERVDRIFAGRESASTEPWREPLVAARQAAAALQRRREQAGALVLDTEEPEFAFDQHGGVEEVRPRVQTESHRMIEHLMIAANEAVARLLEQRGIPCLFRVHERPDPARIEHLADQLASLEVPTPPLPEHTSPSQAAELVGAISRRVDEHVRRTGRGRTALGSLVLRSLKQAYYSPANLGHAGLRSACYCHFTSPIRRYPDIVCHRALLSAIGGPESAPRAGELAELGEWTSEREREAMSIERDADDIARCFALRRELYERGGEHLFEGEVVGIIPAGAFLAFPTAAERYEGMLPLRTLRAGAAGREARSEEWWQMNELGTILERELTGSRLRLTDRIDVRVDRVDAIRGRVDLVPAA